MLKYCFNPLHQFIWLLEILLFAFLSIYYLYARIISETSNEKKLMLGFSCFWFGLTINRIIQTISYYFTEGLFKNHSYYIYTERTSLLYELLMKYSYLSTLIGFLVLIFTIERIIKFSKYVFTLISSLILIVFLIETRMGKPFILIEFTVLSLLIFWISKRENEIFQAVSAFIAIGFIIMAIGFGLDTQIVIDLNIISRFIPLLLIILGAFFTFIPRIVSPEAYTRSRPIIFWLILIFFTLIALPIFINILLLEEIPIELFFTLTIGIFIVIIIFIFGIIRIRKIMKKKEFDKENSSSFLRMFLKPQKLTEEEITLHKNKKICLVCKDKITRVNYICPKCDALYCEKCSDTLSTLENLCWACETIIDESKPTKIFE